MRVAVGALALLASISAMLVSSTLFRYYSPILDEPVYVMQAKALLNGDLTLPAEQARFHQPFFTGVRGDRLVFKYTPVWPAVLAASQALFGSMRLALGATAAAAVVAMALFARELTGDRRRGVAAAALLALCPLFVFHAALFVSYVFSLACSLWFGWGLLNGLRRGARPPLLVAGVALGAGLFARPFDTLLFAGPLLAYAVLRYRRELGRLAGALGWVGAAAAPFVLASLAFNNHVMGHPLQVPFSVTDPLDKPGFGPRRVYPGPPPFDYGPAEAVAALKASLRLVPQWVYGSAVLVAAAVYGLFKRHDRPEATCLLLLAAAFPLGYMAHYGAWTASVVAPVYNEMGPFYYLPILVPLCIAAAPVAVAVAERFGVAGSVVAGVGLTAVTLVAVWSPLQRNVDATRSFHDAYRPFRQAALSEPALVFLPQLGGPFLMNPYRALVNEPDLSGPLLYALDRGPENIDLVKRSARTPYQYFPEERRTRSGTAPVPRLSRLRLERASAFELSYRVTNTTGRRVVTTFLTSPGGTTHYVLDRASTRGATYDITWRLSPRDATLAAPPGRPLSSLTTLPPASTVAVAVTFGEDERIAGTNEWYEHRYQVHAGGGVLTALFPGEMWRRSFARGEVWAREDVTPTLRPAGRRSLEPRPPLQ